RLEKWMNHEGLWTEPMYRETVFIVLAFLLFFGTGLFLLSKRGANFLSAWASLKSWLFTAPLVLFFFALPSPWPLIFAVLFGIFGAKTYYQMVGMYHRSWFVWLTYISISALGLMIYYGYDQFYNLMPMIFF